MLEAFDQQAETVKNGETFWADYFIRTLPGCPFKPCREQPAGQNRGYFHIRTGKRTLSVRD